MNTPTWQHIIAELTAGSLTYKALGEKIGCAASTIGDLASGRSREPVGMVAVRLMRLHENHTRRLQRSAQRAA